MVNNRTKLYLFRIMLSLIPYFIILIALIYIDFDFTNKVLFGTILITPMLHRDIKDGTFKQIDRKNENEFD